MKKNEPEVEKHNLKVWCEHCSIRIAPNEIRVASDGKIYHQNCYERSAAARSKAVGASARSGKILGRGR